MPVFKMKGEATLHAENLPDALLKLAEHFRMCAEGCADESVLLDEGKIEVFQYQDEGGGNGQS